MLYWYLKPLLFLLYRANFKRFFITGKKNIPDGKPVFFASNHTNAFLDAILPAALSKRSFHFLTRGDIFKGGLVTWVLQSMNQIPIYRQRDGRESLQKNEETFRVVYQKLAKNKLILIFPEADCFPIKRLRSLKKGTALMAFGAMTAHNWELDPYIVPVGLNYVNHEAFRTEVMLNINKPIRIKDYQSLFEESEGKAHRQLTQDLEDHMREMVIEVDKSIEKETEFFLALYRHDQSYPRTKWYYQTGTRAEAEKRIAAELAEKKEQNETDFQTFWEKAKEYQQGLSNAGITDKGLASVLNKRKTNFLHFLLFPIGLLSYGFNLPIYRFADNKMKSMVKKKEFKNSVRMGVILVVYNILIFVLFPLVAYFYSFLEAALVLASLYFFSLFGIWNREALQEFRERRKAERWRKKDGAFFGTLVEMRKELTFWK